MNHARGGSRSGRVAWVLAAALTMGSSFPAIAGQIGSPEMDALTPGFDPSDQTFLETKPPKPTPTPSPDPSPTPTASPEPSPTPTQTPEPSPEPTPEPSPDSTPASPKPSSGPPSSGDGGAVGPTQSSGSLDPSQQEHSVGLEEPSDTESPQQHAGAAVESSSSFIESVASILDQLASVDTPIGGPQFPCRASVCGSPLSSIRPQALALASICIILAVVGAFGVWARRRRSFADSSAEDA
jgi:hypothetical protein